jgi:hypothetical protein
MFGAKTQRRPTDSEFIHDEGCKTPRAAPEWGHLGGSEWERTCSCRREVWRAADDRLDPNSLRAMPSWRAHRHSPSCEAAEVEAVIKIERRDGSSGWRSTCSVCTSQWVYYWRPDMVDEHGRPVRREANVFYTYELAHQPVPT